MRFFANYRSRLFIISALFGSFVGLFASVILLPPSPPPVSSIRGLDTKIELERWSSYLRETSAKTAYASFVEVYKDAPYDLQHVMGHVLGGLLYANEGMDGISLCDDSFGFACFHQFSIDAIKEKGTEVIEKLSQICNEKNGSQRGLCKHGIGHGVLEYYGSNDEGLVRALNACVDFFDTSDLSYCADGIFMEYHGVLFGGDESIRPVDESDPFRLCATTVPYFKNECYRSLGRWWISYYRDIERGIELCSIVPAEYKSVCYVGIGSYLPLILNFERERIYEVCDQLLDKIAHSSCHRGVDFQLSAQGS